MTLIFVAAWILAFGVAARVPVVEVALVLGAIAAPVLCLALVLGIVARTAFEAARSEPVDPAVSTIVAVAGELNAGRTLRAVAADGHFGAGLASRARHGLELESGGDTELHDFGRHATLVQATLTLAAQSGAAVAHVFERLAADLIEAERTRRDRRAAMAPAIAQAVVVAGVPLVALAQMIVSGRWLDLAAEGSLQAAMLATGTIAVVAGVAWILVLVRSRSRS